MLSKSPKTTVIESNSIHNTNATGYRNFFLYAARHQESVPTIYKFRVARLWKFLYIVKAHDSLEIKKIGFLKVQSTPVNWGTQNEDSAIIGK